MPIQYDGIIAETLHTRKAASCFDICHMGEFLIKGECKRSGLDNLMSAGLLDLRIGSCRYSPMLNEDGGVIDDLIIYRKAREEWMIVVNAATVQKDKDHMLKHLSGSAEFSDLSGHLGKIDIQGPASKDIVLTLAPGASRLNYYTFIQTNILGEKNIVSRTGYTGELGFEIYTSIHKVESVWTALLKDKRVKPAGLGCRDVLRLEMGYSLYGQDIDETTTPLEAGLEKFIDWGKDFIGKSSLLKQKAAGLNKSRIFLKTLTRRSPRHNHRIYLEGNPVGIITSGTFSPHLEKGIGMGFAQNINLDENQKISVGDENLKIEAVITGRPFLKNTSLKRS